MSAPAFNAIDWLILVGYLAGIAGVGLSFARKQKTLSDYFLGARKIPVWAAAVSIVATSVSAVTFIGAPEDAYKGNLTYLSLNLSAFLAVLVVAIVFIPAFYRHNVSSIYELLGRRFGPGAQRSASAMFMLGRVFASGARLFVAAIPFSLIAFGDLAPRHLYLAIAIVAGVATLYTMIGGIRAVIWTEVPQTLLFFAAAIAAITLLLHKIPLTTGQVFSTLAEAKTPDGATKLTLFDTRADPSIPFSLWSALTGLLLFNMAVYGADQDLAQRMLTCRTAVKGAWSAILSSVIGLVVALLFLSIGLLLYLYHRPDIMGSALPGYIGKDTRETFLAFILHETPAGLRGLMMAGVFATAMSSLASALSAMASTAVVDFYKPMIPGREERHYLVVSRFAVVGWGALLAGFACLCVSWQQESREGLLPFAIGVMIFAYTGLLAVFLTALFTQRGSTRSVIGALVVGFLVVLFLRVGVRTEFIAKLAPGIAKWRLSLGWQMLAGTALAFLVCIAGRTPSRAAPAPTP